MYDTNQKSKPHVVLCGAFVGKGKPLGGNKTTPTGATQRLYEPQPLSGLWSWVVGFGLPSGLAHLTGARPLCPFGTSPHPVGSHPFKFAGVFVLLIEKGIVIDFLFRKVDAVDFLKGRSALSIDVTHWMKRCQR